MKANRKKDPVVSDPVLEAQMEKTANQQATDQANAQQMSEALVKQPADLPTLTTVKGRDGKDKLAARQKGRFANTANARVLAIQKTVEKIMHVPDEAGGLTQLEKILISNAIVCEKNTDARNEGGVTKFLEHLDEIGGTKDARKALTKEANTPVIPVVIINVGELMNPEVVNWDKEQREAAERARKGPSFADSTIVQQNPPRNSDRV